LEKLINLKILKNKGFFTQPELACLPVGRLWTQKLIYPAAVPPSPAKRGERDALSLFVKIKNAPVKTEALFDV